MRMDANRERNRTRQSKYIQEQLQEKFVITIDNYFTLPKIVKRMKKLESIITTIGWIE